MGANFDHFCCQRTAPKETGWEERKRSNGLGRRKKKRQKTQTVIVVLFLNKWSDDGNISCDVVKRRYIFVKSWILFTDASNLKWYPTICVFLINYYFPLANYFITKLLWEQTPFSTYNVNDTHRHIKVQ